MKKIIVTGAGGFIGHHLVKKLKEQNAYVTGIDIKHPEFEASFADQFVSYDLRQTSDELTSLFKQVDEVWALAADMGGMGFISKNHAAIMKDNVLININTLDAAAKSQVRKYLYTSSACIYPEFLQLETQVVPLKETMAYPAQPQDGYGWEKLYTEILCQYYGKEYGMDMRIVRFHNIYGPLGTWQGGREKSPAAMCRKVAEAVLMKKDHIEIWGDGEQTRTFCHIDDCIKGLEKIMASEFNGPINLGRDEMVSINQLADIVMEVAGAKFKKVHIDGPQGVRGRNSDNELCKKVIGWSPEIDLHTGLKQTYQWIFEEVEKSLKSASVPSIH